MTNFDFIVIGAGISGLAAATQYQNLGKNGIILETKAEIGGCINTINFTADNTDYFLELGAHSCFNSYSGLIALLNSLTKTPALDLLPLPKLPFLVKTNHSISSVVKALNLPLLLWSLIKLLWLNKSNKTVAEYYGSIVGINNYQQIIKHALSAVSSQSVDNMPVRFLFQKRTKNKKIPAKFSGKLANNLGLKTMILAIARQLIIKTDRQINNIQTIENGWQITANNEIFTTEKLILATPANVTSHLLTPSCPEISLALSTFKMTEFDTVAVLLKNIGARQCAGWIGVEQDFYSMVSGDVLNPSQDLRGFSFHFKPGRLPSSNINLWLEKNLNISKQQIIKIWQKKNILPIITHNHYQKLEILQDLLPANLAITGNYFTGMAIEDCIQRSITEVKRISAQ